MRPSVQSHPRFGGYELLLALASGGMASVHIARRIGAAGFERLVVLKRVHPHLLQNGDFHDMFRDEARVSSLIRHTNVVSVIDVVEDHGELLLVLEYVESVAMSVLLRRARERGERVPPPIVARIVADALAGLHAAHETKDLRGDPLHIVHRDVSPDNVIVGTDGTSRLIDFGIAKAASRVVATTGGALKGKLAYMSPEHVKQLPLDRRADVFASGIVLHEALAGRPLFRGEDDGDIVLRVLLGEIPDPSTVTPDVPVALDAVVQRALARSREERFATALEFQEALERAIPLASPREVARFVATVAGSLIVEREKLLRASLESSRGHEVTTSTTVDMAGASSRPKSRRTSIVLLLSTPLLAIAGYGIPKWMDAQHTRNSEPVPVTNPSAMPSVASSPPAESVDPVVAVPTSPLRPPATAPLPDRTGRHQPSDLHRNPYGR